MRRGVDGGGRGIRAVLETSKWKRYEANEVHDGTEKTTLRSILSLECEPGKSVWYVWGLFNRVRIGVIKTRIISKISVDFTPV